MPPEPARWRSPPPTSPPLPNRLMSLDVYRGLAMFLMVAEALHLCRVAGHFPNQSWWQWLCEQQTHVSWVGCSVHDMIQPSFTFLVGAALPFSLASRQARGQSSWHLHLHAWWRALILVFMGIFLRSLSKSQTNWTFEDTLTQIGLGYGFAFLLACRPVRDQWIALVVILAGYWGAFALYPLPPENFNYESVGVPQDWPHLATGFAAHWNKNANLATAFDQWFMNLFPRQQPYVFNGGGYQTLSFIPTLGTMLMGLIAGGIIKRHAPTAILLRLVVIGAASTALGYAWDYYGYCPLVKRIWTPSFTLFSGGICFLILAAFYLIIDVIRLRFWAFPLAVIGMNSIAIYWMSWTMEDFVLKAVKTHLGESVFLAFGPEYETLMSGSAVILTFWLILFYMYRRKIFVRV